MLSVSSQTPVPVAIGSLQYVLVIDLNHYKNLYAVSIQNEVCNSSIHLEMTFS